MSKVRHRDAGAGVEEQWDILGGLGAAEQVVWVSHTCELEVLSH